MIELVAFLGNPENEYGGARHNAGRMLAERLSIHARLSWQKKYRGLYASLDCAALLQGAPAGAADAAPDRFHFIMPETYMNDSGESVRAAASFFKIPPERVLAVHDEIEMPPGMAGFKFGGGLGGHNGLRSLKACLGTADFWRLRIGVGRPGDREPGKGGPQGVHGDIIGWVLSPFDREELPLMDRVFQEAARALEEALLRGPETMLPRWNKWRIGDS